MAAKENADGEEEGGGALHDDGAGRHVTGIEVEAGERKDAGGDEERKGIVRVVHVLESMTQCGAQACKAIS
jgi:hypothetical protein